MSGQITIEPVTRIEGHATITISLDDDGRPVDAQFQVTQFRGFEKLCEGRPYYEMPSITERICGICPVSHSLAAGRACDAILGIHPPEAARLLRRLLNCAAFIQSHALSFYYLSLPDLLPDLDGDPDRRNILGLAAAHPAVARDGIRLRQLGQRIIELISGKRIHAAWVVPGGVNAPLSPEHRDEIRRMLPEALAIAGRAIALCRQSLGRYREESETFANFPTMFMGMVDGEGKLDHTEGRLRIVDAHGHLVADGLAPEDYPQYIGERVEKFSYLKSPYYRPKGYPDGIYRVGPAARLNVASGCGTPLADREWTEFRGLGQGAVLSSFANHYARLIEILFAIETIDKLLESEILLDTRVRALAQPNFPEGIGCVEAPRGTLIHHYRIDEHGLMTWANLIVATGHNNLAMNRGILQVAKRFINGPQVPEEARNRVEAVIRAFDPCLSCSTHALGGQPLSFRFIRPDGTVIAGSGGA